jgi:hypothetical protein
VSSSTSTSSRHGGRLLALALPPLLLLGGVAATNFWQDPYGRFTAEPRPLPRTNFGAHDLALHSVVELARMPGKEVREADVIIAGESRAFPLTGRRTSSARGQRVLNLSIPSGSLEEYLDFLKRELPRVERPRLVIVTVSFERLTEPTRPDRIPQAAALLRSPLHYLLNRQVFAESLAQRRRGGQAEAPPAMAKASASAPDPRIAATWEPLRRFYDPALPQARLALVREAIAPIRARGIAVVLWAPPLRADMLAGMEAAGFYPEWERLAKEIGAIAPLVDLTKERELDRTAFTFLDPSHHRNGALILDHLIEVGLPQECAGGQSRVRRGGL